MFQYEMCPSSWLCFESCPSSCYVSLFKWYSLTKGQYLTKLIIGNLKKVLK